MTLNVLIIRLSAIGDVIHTLPLAAAIKAMAPDSHLTWVVQPAASSLVRNNPTIDRVIEFPAKGLLRAGINGQARQALGGFWRDLRAQRYDVALDAQGLFKSAILTYLSGAKIRIGFKNTREFADRFLTEAVDVGNYRGANVHVVDLNLRLADRMAQVLGLEAPAGGHHPRFILPEPPAESVAKVDSWLGENYTYIYDDSIYDESSAAGTTRKSQLAVLMPGTTWATKIWPEEYWHQLGTRIAKEMGFRLALVGGPSEQTTCSSIESALKMNGVEPVLNLAGKTSLLDLVALLPRAGLVIGGDTGPLHLAAAVQAPHVVGVFGSTPAIRNGPYGQNAETISLDLDCQPCFQKTCPLGTRACLVELTPDLVFARITDRLGK